MFEKLLEKIKSSYPDSFEEIKQIIDSKNYHLILNLDLKETIKIKILRHLFSQKYVNIFKTRKARELQVQILNKIKNYISTPYAKELLLTFFPTTNKQEILSRQKRVKSFHKTFLSIKDDIETVRSLIQNISTITYSSDKRHNGIAIAFADETLYDDFKSILSKKFYVTFIESEHDILAIDHYEQIRFVPGNNPKFTSLFEQLPQSNIINGDVELSNLAPEFITDILEENKNQIESLERLNAYISLPNFSSISSSNFKRIPIHIVEKEILDLATHLEVVIQSQISKANFSGDVLMSIISNQKNIVDILDVASREIIRAKKQEILNTSADILGTSTVALFSIDHLGKVTLDSSQFTLLKNSFLNSQEQEITRQKQNSAIVGKDLVDSLPSLVEFIYNLDLSLSIGQFIDFFNLEQPTLIENGFSFVYGRNMNISNVVPVEYYLGQEINISVLTGANSGGKTTLLELVGQIQILTQMGLFVPANDANISIIEELYYFSKNKGSLSAGAFETLLKQFAGIGESNSSRLILADEIESVTEPSVAAKIIKGIIQHLSKQEKTLLMLVTHMGNELAENPLPCRFDGIEAKGLDKELNLVVDRNPIIGRVARSTPQLIIERLTKINNNPFYKTLHEAVIK